MGRGRGYDMSIDYNGATAAHEQARDAARAQAAIDAATEKVQARAERKRECARIRAGKMSEQKKAAFQNALKDLEDTKVKVERVSSSDEGYKGSQSSSGRSA